MVRSKKKNDMHILTITSLLAYWYKSANTDLRRTAARGHLLSKEPYGASTELYISVYLLYWEKCANTDVRSRTAAKESYGSSKELYTDEFDGSSIDSLVGSPHVAACAVQAHLPDPSPLLSYRGHTSQMEEEGTWRLPAGYTQGG
jgi:hypothetical protein